MEFREIKRFARLNIVSDDFMHTQPGAAKTVLPDPVRAGAEPAEGVHLRLGVIEADAMIKKFPLQRIVIIELQRTIAAQRPSKMLEPGGTAAFNPSDGHAAFSVRARTVRDRRGFRCRGRKSRGGMAESYHLHRDGFAR